MIAGNTDNVVCNTSFTNLSDSRVKTAEADVAELKQLFDSVEAKQCKRPDMNEDLRLGFALDDFAGTKWKNLTGAVRWSDGTEMVTLDYSHLTSVLWGVCKGFQARLDEVEAWQAQRGHPSSFLGQQVGVSRPPHIRGTLLKPFFGATKLNGGAEGPGRRLQRAGPAEAVPTRTAARPRRDAGHGLRGAEGRRGPAGAGAPATRAGQVGR